MKRMCVIAAGTVILNVERFKISTMESGDAKDAANTKAIRNSENRLLDSVRNQGP